MDRETLKQCGAMLSVVHCVFAFFHAQSWPGPGNSMPLHPSMNVLWEKGWSPRTAISLLVGFLAIPGVFAIWFFTDAAATAQRKLIDHTAERAVYGITGLIDNEINVARSLVTSLSISRSILEGDFHRFDTRAKEIARQLGIQIALVDPYRNEQITNTAVDWGAPRAKGLRFIREAIDQQMSDQRGAAVSNVFFAPLAGHHIVAVTLPVLHDGSIVYFLSIGIPTKKFATILRNSQIPDQWAVSIVDRNNGIVARSEKHERFVGTKIVNDFLDAGKTFGRWDGVNRDGVPFQWTYLHSAATGWFVTIGVPGAVLAKPHNQALTIFASSAFLLLGVAFGCAYLVGGKIQRQHDEREQARLRRAFIKAQEDERLRLARELHDEAGQGITAVMLQLKGLEAGLDEGRSLQLRKLRAYLDQMGQALHRVAADLRPASINELGVADSLLTYVADWESRSGIEVDFHCADGLDALPDDVKTAVFRIVQEALTNVAKHALGATTVSVVINCLPSGLSLIIEDNGCGISSDELARKSREHRLGIAGMRERLRGLGSDLEIESTPGQGTAIFARIPRGPERMVA